MYIFSFRRRRYSACGSNVRCWLNKCRQLGWDNFGIVSRYWFNCICDYTPELTKFMKKTSMFTTGVQNFLWVLVANSYKLCHNVTLKNYKLGTTALLQILFVHCKFMVTWCKCPTAFFASLVYDISTNFLQDDYDNWRLIWSIVACQHNWWHHKS